VEVEGRTVALPRKGLALLCYLAFEGPTRRQRLADLLWDRAGAMKNLRVEIHRARAPLRELGIEPFDASSDPLALGPQIRVARGATHRSDELMAGLEDVASGFQAWLDTRRAHLTHDADPELRGDLLDDLAKTVEPPFVVVLQARPGAETRSAARRLARRLNLPFFEDARFGRAGVHFVRPDRHDALEMTRTICRDADSVWIIERSRFGEDPTLLLQLRAEYPADRLRFVDVPPLTWSQARALLPPSVDFDEAARMYLASDGNPRYLKELVKLRGERPFGPTLPVPQRMRAAIAVEADRLSSGARSALERLTVAPEPISPEVIAAFGAEAHLDELERASWLTFDAKGWAFTDRLARALLFERLPPGHRARLVTVVHDLLAKETASRDRVVGARVRGGTPPASSARPPVRAVRVGDEVWVDEPDEVAPHGAWADGTLHLVHVDRTVQPVAAAFRMPAGPILVRLSGRAFVGHPSHRVAPRPPTAFARITFGGRPRRSLWLRDSKEASRLPGEQLELPSRDAFDHWILVHDARTLSIAGTSTRTVAEVAVRFHRPDARPPSDGFVVEALAIDGLAWPEAGSNDPARADGEPPPGSVRSEERPLET
jgi:hypothetical protein